MCVYKTYFLDLSFIHSFTDKEHSSKTFLLSSGSFATLGFSSLLRASETVRKEDVDMEEANHLGMMNNIEELRQAYTHLQQEMASLRMDQRPKSRGGVGGSARAVKPPEFDGRVSTEVHAWVWTMEKYFIATEVNDDEERMKLVDTLLRKAAADWRRANETLNSWHTFKDAVIKRFAPLSEMKRAAECIAGFAGHNARRIVRLARVPGAHVRERA